MSELSMYQCIHLSCVIGSRGEITVMTFHLKHGHPKHPTCPIFNMSFVINSRQTILPQNSTSEIMTQV